MTLDDINKLLSKFEGIPTKLYCSPAEIKDIKSLDYDVYLTDKSREAFYRAWEAHSLFIESLKNNVLCVGGYNLQLIPSNTEKPYVE